MKNKSIILLTSFSLAFSVAIGVATLSNGEAKEAAAIGNYSTDAATYYSGITATSGKQLAGQLHDLITSTHRYYTSYADNGANGYQKNTDRYYENGSPVSGYIYEFYSGVKWPDGWYPGAGQTGGGYNREHCWCQSNSVNAGGTQMWGESGGGGDMHHLRPVETRLNSTRNNHPYGEVSNRDSHKSYAKFGTNETYALGGYCFDDTFEPLDSKKGDVARIILYTYLHYNSYTVSEVFGGNASTNGNGSSSYFSTSLLSLTKIMKPSTEADALEMLLSWNESDPVDDIEIRRNNQVAVYQGNRNPFIDNSDYAEMIWGSGTSSTDPKVNSVSVSPSNLELDVNGTTTGNLTATVSVSNDAPTTVTWSSSNENVATVSDTGVVTAVAKGSCTITATSTFNSNKSASCSVKVVNTSGGGGGHSETGSFTWDLSTNSYDSNPTANLVTWSHDYATMESIRTDNSKTAANNYLGGDSDNRKSSRFYSGNTLRITPASDYTITSVEFTATGDSYATALSNSTWTNAASSASSTTVTVTPTNGANVFSAAIYGTCGFTAVKVYYSTESGGSSAPTLDSISLNTSNVQTEFVIGDTFDYSGLVVVATYDDGTGDIVNPTNVSTPDMSTAGDKTVTVSYTEGGVTAEDTYEITVNEPEPTVDSVEISDDEISLDVYNNKTKTLTATVIGEHNPSQDIRWESSDEDVATVSDVGVVTAVAEGTCTITAYSDYDDEYFATCDVVVTDSTPSGDATTITTNIGTYATNHSWSNGVRYASMALDSIATASVGPNVSESSNTGKYYTSGNEWRFYQSDANAAIVISVAEGYVLNSVTFTYNVSNGGVLKDSSNNSVTSGSYYLISGESSITFTIGNSGSATNGHVRFTSISVTYCSSSGSGEPTLSSITLDTENVQKQFFVGDTFTYEGLVVTAHYSDESSSEVTPTSVSSPDMTTAGEKTITVTYTEDEVSETATYTINVEEQTASSISAGTDKVFYHPGEIITKDNITVTDDLDNEITNFDFTDYMVTYEDAPSGDGSEEITLENAITYGNLTCDLQFYATREMYQEVGTVSDTLNKESTGNPSSYKSWSGVNGASGAVYAGHSSGGNDSIQLRSGITDNAYNSGIITTSSNKNILSVTVTWEGHTTNGRVLNVYGSNTVYSSPNDLYDSNKQGTLLGTIVYGTSTKLNVTGDYKYVGVCSAANAMYLTDITFEYADSDTATNVSNFIMYEDTEGQCVTKFDQALDLLNTLSSAEKELFWNSDNYVISHARERLQKWAIHEKVTLSFVDDEFVAESTKNVYSLLESSDSSNLIIVIVSLLSLSSISGYFLIKRKKDE